jgi:5'-methylthioadenosine phosphorylase
MPKRTRSQVTRPARSKARAARLEARFMGPTPPVCGVSGRPESRTDRAGARIGVIGGSGLYAMPGLTGAREVRLRTPFGAPSDAFLLGTLAGLPAAAGLPARAGRSVAFLARHGRGHRILPGEINFRANIYAMKLLGVERIISVSAVGSLREELRPLEFLIPDQFFDRTHQRPSTFFGGGIVAHVGFDRPTCPELSAALAEACDRAGVPVHRAGTYVCIEGPQFSTLAESNFYRQARFDVIGMTNITEARLAREAEICYSTVAMITDYDCWHPGHATVTGEMILANLNRNVENVQKVLREALAGIPGARGCRCGEALAHAILTERACISARARRVLRPLIGKYLG